MKIRDIIEALEVLESRFGNVPVMFATGPGDTGLVAACTYVSDDEKVVWVDLDEPVEV